MSSQRAVKLLTTGGTIATQRGADGVTRPILTALQLRNLIFDRGGPTDVDIDTESLSLRPSWSFGPADLDAIARAAVREARDERFAGVIVTHGTTTMEYSAFLTDLRHDGRAPIVFTGAMRRADAPEPDGPANLCDAVAVAADPSAADRGCLIVMSGRILSAREAWKGHKRNIDAFIGLDGGLGHVAGGIVEVVGRPRRRRSFQGDLEPRVAIVKAYPGAGRELIDAAVDAGHRGIVVEGLPGVGGVPEAMQVGLRDATEGGVSVVLTSRAPYGRMPPEVSGGTGEPLADIGLVSSGDLTTEKAWVLLMAALGEAGSPEEARWIVEDVAGTLSVNIA